MMSDCNCATLNVALNKKPIATNKKACHKNAVHVETKIKASKK